MNTTHPSTKNKKSGTEQHYHCPMGCEGDKTYDHPMPCPVCGMNLVKEETINTPQASKWTCSMHPEVVEDQPGPCPICGMELIPLVPKAEDEDITFRSLKRKFIVALIFTIPVFLIAMSEMLPGQPLFKIMDQLYWNWVQLALSLPVMFYACWMFFQRAFTSVKTRHLNMFTLIGLGSGVAWIFSVFGMVFPEIFPDQFKTESGAVHVYFEAATVILTLVLLGQLLEAKAHSKTSSAVKSLLKLAPSVATRVEDNQDHIINIEDINPGDILKVKPGEKIPVDGSIISGSAHINESMITGEPLPVNKNIGDPVSSGTLNGTTSFLFKAEKVGSDTLLSQIINLVNSASRSRAPIQNLADKVSSYFVPAVIIIAVLTFGVWSIWGPEPRFVYAFVNAVAVIIVACPCALGLATPMSVTVGIGKGAQNGVLIKNAEAIELMSKIEKLVIDKTGTVTEGKPQVITVESFDKTITKPDLLTYLVSINQSSEHPLATAALEYGKAHGITSEAIENFETIAGMGVVAKVNSNSLAVGNDKLMNSLNIELPQELLSAVQHYQNIGNTVSYISVNDIIGGFVVIGDQIKTGSKHILERLKSFGLDVIMLTGDNQKTASAIANQLNIDRYKAELLPQDKLHEIETLQADGFLVGMAGDGINDAPSLAQANVGIAMGTGTDVAIESSEITLLNGEFSGLVKARLLSKGVMRNIKENLFFALAYNALGIPIAAGLLYPFFGILLSPMIAALAMSFSSVSVIANALRLRRITLK